MDGCAFCQPHTSTHADAPAQRDAIGHHHGYADAALPGEHEYADRN